MGCEVTLALDGAEAIEAIKSKYFPIVFLDCQVPKLDGLDVTREIRRLQDAELVPVAGDGAPTKMIALPANVSIEHTEACLATGMDGYLQKPCKCKDFAEMMQKHLNYRSHERA